MEFHSAIQTAFMNDRFFYHSFPRLRRGETPEQQVEKGLRILALIGKTGLVLAPEIVVWKQPTQDGNVRVLEQLQKRICFTELSEADLPEHGRHFGRFAIEFDLAALRGLGAVPVSYIPQTIGELGASAVGATLVAGLFDARYTMDPLPALRDPVMQLDTGRFQGMPVLPECTLNLQNTDSSGAVVHSYTVPRPVLKNVLDYLGFQNAPFGLVRGALNAMLSLFYPADDDVNDTILGYYRQREWRIVSGIQMGHVALSGKLTPQESREVSGIDHGFWDRTLSIRFPASHARTFRRIDEAESVSKLGTRHVRELIRSVIVPPSALDDPVLEIFRETSVSVRAL